MAADNETRLLSRVIRDRDISLMMERGVQDDWFVNRDDRDVWVFLRKHYARYNEVPTANTVKDNYPTYRLLKVDDTAEYLLDQLIEYRRRLDTIRLIQDATEAIEQGDHEAALGLMAKRTVAIGDAGTIKVNDLDLTDDPMARFKEYEFLEANGGGMLGIPTGFPTIDLATAGLQPGQLITIVALPKVGKSVLAMQVGSNVHRAGHNVALQSFEMSNHEGTTRHDAMCAGISHARLIRGALEPDEKVRYKKMLRAMSLMYHKFDLMDSTAGVTIQTVEAKIELLQPDLFIVDGSYLMIDMHTGERNTPQALTNITRDAKNLAQRKGIPIIITTQALAWKMKNGKLAGDSIGYSSSFLQDSDVLLGLEKDDNDPLSRILRVVEARNCGPTECDLVWDWERGQFEEFSAAHGSIAVPTPAVPASASNNAQNNSGGRP